MNVDADNPLHFSEICRLCLSKEDMMTPIFEEDDKTKKDMPSLATRILMCASLQVEEGDGFPSQICTKCSGHLDNWYAFKEQCHSSDATLRQHLQTDSKGWILVKKNSMASARKQAISTKLLSSVGKNSAYISVSCGQHNKPAGAATSLFKRFLCSLKTVQLVWFHLQTASTKPRKPPGEKKRESKLPAQQRRRGMGRGLTQTRRASKHRLQTVGSAHGKRWKDPQMLLDLPACAMEPIVDIITEPFEVVQLNSGKNDDRISESEVKNEQVCEENDDTLTYKKDFTCSVCKRSFSNRIYLKEHEAMHTGIRAHTCEDCGKTFYSERKLSVHAKTHSKERAFVCGLCGRAFRAKSDMRKHVRLHVEEPSHLCSICGKTYRTKFYLARHIVTHSGEKHFMCHECGKAFVWRDTLAAHARVHAPVRPVSCAICDKTFKRRDDLGKHMRTHTGEKPHLCAYCGRAFSDRWNLTQHVRLHTGDKPYKCGVCGQAFRHNVTLRNHAKQHTVAPETQQEVAPN
uniref:Uncharacterized protein n=1 Tax=Timema shepardi TaxID=629360 RepID=A0A7R9AY10_TIMSH|nr:unnamed protein product [Timema shepardi]